MMMLLSNYILFIEFELTYMISNIKIISGVESENHWNWNKIKLYLKSYDKQALHDKWLN